MHAQSGSQACDTIDFSHLIAMQKKTWFSISLNRCGKVGVGLGASLNGENQIWLEKKYFETFTL
jgi:hypothetical protein